VFIIIIGENLLVGSKQGHLLMYSITPQTADKKHDVQLLRYNKTFSKKPINQLAVVPEYEMLISLSGKYEENSYILYIFLYVLYYCTLCNLYF
jgi:hypothetical protein